MSLPVLDGAAPHAAEPPREAGACAPARADGGDELARARARLRELEAQLQAARSREQARARLLARANHELRNPLTAIIGYAEMLAREGATPRAQALGGLIHDGGRQLLATLGDLMEFLRGEAAAAAAPAAAQQPQLQQSPPPPQSQQPRQPQQPPQAPREAFYMAGLLDGLAARARAWAQGNGNAFTLRLRGAVPQVVAGDAAVLRRVLEQLLSNAAKFTLRGRMALEVSRVAAGRRGGAARAGGPVWLRFTVSDTGPGMDEAALAGLFDPLGRAPDAARAPGLGVGLALARQWALRLGGRLEVASQPGRGTTVSVLLPLAVAAEAQVPRPPRAAHGGPRPGWADGAPRRRAPLPPARVGRVWVVDDCEPVRTLLCEGLAAQGIEAVPLADGAQAIARMGEAARTGEAAPALILTDLHMPGRDGTLVLHAARRRWPRVPVVLLTAMLEREALPPLGFDAVLAKPLAPDALLAELRRLLPVPDEADEADETDETDEMDEGAGGAGRARGAAALPPAAYAQEMLALLRLGAVSDLAERADELMALNPGWSPLLAELRRLAWDGDVQGCRALLREQYPGVADTPAVPVARRM